MAGIPLRASADGGLELPDLDTIERTHVEWLAYWRLGPAALCSMDKAYDALPTSLKLEQEMVFGVAKQDKLCM